MVARSFGRDQGGVPESAVTPLVCVALTFFQLVEVSRDDSKYREIENLFQQTMKDYSIRRLWRTRSPMLWQYFQLFVSALLHSPSDSGAIQIMAGPPSHPPSVWVVPPWQKANRLPLCAALYPSPRGLRRIPRERTTLIL